MSIEELILLLPCHGAEDFPLDASAEDAESLRASWTALWHPALIHAAGSAPSMASTYELPHELEHRVIVMPEICRASLPDGWFDEARTEGAIVIDGGTDRQAISSTALSAAEVSAKSIDEELVADFYALGYSQLHIELITQHLYYTSELQGTDFAEHVVAAATQAVTGDPKTARERIATCFDALSEARDHFHPLDAHLIDVLLVAKTTLGAALQDELACADGPPLNLLIAPELVEMIAAEQPRTLAALREAIAKKRVCLAGGTSEDEPLWLISPEQILAHLRWAIDVYEQHLGARPDTFACRQFAMTPVLPQILSQLGYNGVWHVALDGRPLPQTGQSKIQWEGTDGSTIDALLQMPFDSNDPTGYLKYVQRMSHNMGYDYVATQAFARWPGQSSPWHDDLRRVNRFSPVLGKFTSLDEYFAETDVPGEMTFFQPDEYKPDSLAKSVTRGDADPISRVASLAQTAAAESHRQRGDVLNKLSTTLMSDENEPSSTLAVTNTNSRIETALVDVSSLAGLPADDDTVIVAGQQGARQLAAVRMPAMSRVHLSASVKRQDAAGKVLAEERTLRNDYMEVVIGEHTGAIEKVGDYRTRGNRLSQQLAFRFTTPQRHAGESSAFGSESEYYSVMAADSVEVTENGEVFAEITSHGRLLDLEGRVLSRFEQKFQLWRGCRILHVDCRLEPLHEPESDPWKSYYAMRFAWPDVAADVRRSVNMATCLTNARQIESPLFVEVCSPNWRTGIFSSGTPFYRRVGVRMIDALMIVRRESQCRFRYGIGIDEPRPLPAALSVMNAACHEHPPLADARLTSGAPATGSVESPIEIHPRNFIITNVEAVESDERGLGCRLRLLETEGQGGTARIRFSRRIEHAEQQDLGGKRASLIEFSDHQISLEMTGHAWVQLEVRFAE
ncbi:MAG: hypothetical protein MI757_18405 [Pirellulales bacterium]|nr:hypothetical protein [Pirellulales bacterium]